MVEIYDLTNEAMRVAAVLYKGGRIEARRMFPFEHRFYLSRIDGFRYSTPVSRNTVAALVEGRVVEVDGRDTNDYDRYDLTLRQAAWEIGERAAAVLRGEWWE